MPNRVIREAILDSQRYWSCTIEARELYRHIQLLADDFGCVSLSTVFLKRKCFETPPQEEKVSALLHQLVDADLVRRYEVNGKVFGFIPRFRQRLKRMTLKHPKPPNSLLQDDDYALQQFKEISEKQQIQPPDGRPTAAPRHAEVEVESEVESESEVEVEGKGKQKGKGIGELGAHIPAHLSRQPNESQEQYKNRLIKFSQSNPKQNPKDES